MPGQNMHLEFSGAPEIRATRAQVWRRLLDPHFIARSAPGVETVEPIDANRFRMILAFGVALFKLRLAFDVEMFDIVDGISASMRAHGHAPGTEVEMRSDIRLDDGADERVRLRWTAHSTVSGALTGLGSRLVEGLARRMTAQFWDNFAARVEREPA